MATIRDVAKHAGVAPTTVSRVFNNTGYVGKRVRTRVERSIAELHYVPNVLGLSLRSKRTQIVALILSDVANPFWTTVARGVEDVCSAQGYFVVLCNTDESQAKQDEYVKVMLQKQVDGFLLVPVQNTSSIVQTIQKQNIPVVLLDRTVPNLDVDTVRCDSEEGAYQLTCHLLQQGHRNIAVLSGPSVISTATDRVSGYQRALEEFGVPFDEDNIHWGDFGHQAAYEAVHELLNQDRRPTALFTGNNFITIGAIHALSEAGMRVPEDIALVSFDEFPTGLTIEPFFTSVVQPAYQMGYQATELLLTRIAEEEHTPSQKIVLPTEVVIRRSSQHELTRIDCQAKLKQNELSPKMF